MQSNRSSRDYSYDTSDHRNSTSKSPYNSSFNPADYEDTQHTFNVMGDFNNTSRSYSRQYSSADYYGKQTSPSTPVMTKDNEYVAVPTLGADWAKNEATTEPKFRWRKKGDKDKWGNEYQGLNGIMFMKVTYRQFVFVLFAFLVALAVTLYFVIPRVPSFLLDADNPLTSNVTKPDFSRTPTSSFDFEAYFNIGIDAKSNWLDLHFKKIHAVIIDLNTLQTVGNGTLEAFSIPGKKITGITFPVTFYYDTNNNNDTTFNDFYSACGHIYTTTTRTTLNLGVELSFGINGVIGTKKTSTSLTGINCPVEIAQTNI